MKIGNPADKPTAASASGTAATAQAGAAEAAPRAAHGTHAKGVANVDASATVALSSTAATLLSPNAGVGADFDAEKVARIGAAIAGGSYKVNADAIADKLIANAQELLTRTSA